MPLEVVIPLLIICLFFGVLIANYFNRKAGETADQIGWANVRSVLIYEQTDPSTKTRAETIAQYEHALEMLELHGNQWLGKNKEARSANVFLWIWGADKDNTAVDFDAWKFLNVARRAQIHEAFSAQKAANAARYGNVTDAAKVLIVQDFERDEKGNY